MSVVLSLLAAACSNKAIHFWDMHSGKELRRFRGHEGDELVLYLTFAPDGRSLASIGPDSTVRLWEVCTGRERCRFGGHSGMLTCLALGPTLFKLMTPQAVIALAGLAICAVGITGFLRFAELEERVTLA